MKRHKTILYFCLIVLLSPLMDILIAIEAMINLLTIGEFKVNKRAKTWPIYD